MKNFQQFKKRTGIRAFYPEPKLCGNSNTGNVARRFFRSAKISAEILGIPRELISTIWELLVAVNSTKLQDIQNNESVSTAEIQNMSKLGGRNNLV